MTTPLTEAREAEIRAREQAATPGPWRPCEHWRKERCGCGDHPGYIWDGSGEICVAQMGCQPDCEGDDAYPQASHEQRRADAHFIAQARQDVPDLLTALDSERAKVAELVKVLEHAQRFTNQGHSNACKTDPKCIINVINAALSRARQA